ncbi:DUF5718 family protein [Paraconexibacter antarcticus]|uniref:DUF5718 family protein n=1 Tax=Paraconexibacter antarcticus TaxID=2949664 RepID=A0ABY5DN11_9ACTN|nr:DUF5718 family protein [Paraconexibacter antarcticus]UTI62578.1 DUF5718 family protein [Paraconexibacter antarcticus]
MQQLELDDLRGIFGFGVAGNFAGHLEQAGEAGDFASVQAPSDEAPKGIFPWYVPGHDSFLGTFPLAFDVAAKPREPDPVNLQIEPEVGLLCGIAYAGDGSVAALQPQAIAAFDDCSVRRPGAPKISHKKNWGADSKGVAPLAFEVTDLSPDGPTKDFRLASFLRRGNVTRGYGTDSPLPGYSYYGQQLLDWLVDRLNHQKGAEDTPLEDVGALLRAAGNPERALVGIGATRYEPFGARTYLMGRDEAVVVVYDSTHHRPNQVAGMIADRREEELEAASVLRRMVYDLRDD